jgi:hypothetical protein
MQPKKQSITRVLLLLSNLFYTINRIKLYGMNHVYMLGTEAP